MYRDISATIDALNNISASIANNKICREQIENLSSGLQNDNIDTSESVQQKFTPNVYSRNSSSISINDAKYIKDTIEIDIAHLADNNRREALTLAINSIALLVERIKYITGLKDPDLDKLETIKKYFNRPKMKFDVYDDSLQQDIECEYIPLEIFNNRDQLSTFKSLANDSTEANYTLEAIYGNSAVHFYSFLNWICKALKDNEMVSDEYNWRLLFENNSISPVNICLISEAIVDGRLLNILCSLKAALEIELSYAILDKVDSLKTIHLTSKEITSDDALDSFKYANVFDKMYKDKISLLFIEFLYLSVFSKNKQI